MPKDMNLCVNVNGQSQVPPGFRFHPTEEELLHYYLRKKVSYDKIDLDVIRDVDLNKLEPWDIQEKCKIGSTPQNDWYFFSHKDKKYPTGTRTNRATAAGFWKATGRDKVIYSSFKRIGMRKTLVFYKGRAPHGQKSDWIMHEYRLFDDIINPTTSTATSTFSNDYSNATNVGDQSTQEDGWVVCRVFKKKNYHKALESGSPQRSIMDSSRALQSFQTQTAPNHKDEGGDGGSGGGCVLDQILHYMGRSNSCKQENETITNFIINNHNSNLQFIGNIQHHEQLLQPTRFFHLPRLDESPSHPSPNDHDHIHQEESHSNNKFKIYCGNGSRQSMSHDDEMHELEIPVVVKDTLDNWADLDRLVASQLNAGATTTHSQQQVIDDKNLYLCYGEVEGEANDHQPHHFSSNLLIDQNSTKPNNIVYGSEIDLWSFARSSSSSSSPDPLCHLSV